MSEIKTISPRQAAEKGASAMFIDVRTPAEFEEVHIDGAVLHPLSDLKAEVVKELTQHKSDCVVVCRSGGRAKQAFEKLAHSGVTGLCILEGGMTAWQGEGLPVVRGKKTISLERQVRIAAGSLVFIGSVLGYFVHPGLIALAGFVGAGLVFAGVTDTCGMAMMLATMPWNTRAAGATAAQGATCSNPVVGGSTCSTKGN